MSRGLSVILYIAFFVFLLSLAWSVERGKAVL